ncbi:MAG: hypothetical protein EBQ95_03790 [Gammaproteobacteria bacterium]|nr:hypothetical protein [Gammaproteobacteria bacterium]
MNARIQIEERLPKLASHLSKLIHLTQSIIYLQIVSAVGHYLQPSHPSLYSAIDAEKSKLII